MTNKNLEKKKRLCPFKWGPFVVGPNREKKTAAHGLCGGNDGGILSNVARSGLGVGDESQPSILYPMIQCIIR